MKKLYVVLVAALSLLCLVACGRTDTPMNTNSQGTMPSILPTMDTNIPDPDTNRDVTENTWMTVPGMDTENTEVTNK